VTVRPLRHRAVGRNQSGAPPKQRPAPRIAPKYLRATNKRRPGVGVFHCLFPCSFTSPYELQATAGHEDDARRYAKTGLAALAALPNPPTRLKTLAAPFVQ
jgi:hypothetical protein